MATTGAANTLETGVHSHGRSCENRTCGSPYNYYLGGFLISLAFVFLTLMDIRRGFLFAEYYLKSAWLNYNPLHPWMLAMGVIGLLSSYHLLRRSEVRGEIGERQARALAKVTALAIFGILVTTLVFLYRGIAMARILEAGKMSIPALGLNPAQLPGTKELMPLSAAPYLLKPLAIAVNYMSLVWGATTLAVLLSGLTATAAPIFFRRLFSPAGSGAGKLRPLLGGMIYGVPQPFCSCCAAPVSASIYRSSGSIAASVAFLLTSPTLNVTALILAASLLPAPYAMLRIAGGAFFVVAAAFLTARFAERIPREESPQPPRGFTAFVYRAFNRFCSLFHFEPAEGAHLTPAGVISGWAANSWRAAKVVIPSLFAGSVLAGIAVVSLPATFTNSIAGVLLASSLGTLLMIATWTEIPVASVLLSQGITGPAASLLVTLPAVSLPCLLIFGGALRSPRTAFILGLGTFLFGLVAGLIFL